MPENLLAIVAHCEENDGTDYPWWGICKKAGLGAIEVLAGPFFSRESAEGKRVARIHHYGAKSFVYCFSGHDSYEYRQLYDASKALREARNA